MTSIKKPSEFDKLVETYLRKVIQSPSSASTTPELEIRYTGIVTGEFVSNKDIISITKTDHDNVIQQLISLQYTPDTIDGIQMLRIYLLKRGERETPFPYRCEIYGLKDIQTYCRTNDWTNCPSARFVRKNGVMDPKGVIKDFNCMEYGFKVSLKEEYSVSGNNIHTEPLLANIGKNWNDYDKAFRQMNRTTFSRRDGFVKVDMSVVKSSPKIKGTFEYGPNYNAANLHHSPPSYEVEIEFDNANILHNYTSSVDVYSYLTTIISSSRSVINVVLCGLYQTEFPISKSEMKYVLMDYYSILYIQSQPKSINPISQKDTISKLLQNKPACTTSLFTGPSQVSLQFENIIENDSVDQLSILTNGYAVSDKADGERCLLIVSRQQINSNYKVYLIDMNMRVRFTGVSAKSGKGKDDPPGTIIDGEFVKYDKYGAIINMFLAFDVYAYKYTNVRKNIFIYPSDASIPGEGTQQSRHGLLGEFQTNVSFIFNSPYDMPSPFRFIVKPFLLPNETNTIFDMCREVLTTERPYNNDGLVFAHSLLPVGATSMDKPGPLNKIRWDYSFKWKPPQYNTIDFLVTSPDDDVVHSIDQPGGSENSIAFYKKLELRCGVQFNKQIANAFETAINEDKIAKLQLTYKTQNETIRNIPMIFSPSWFPSADASQCNAIVKHEYGIPRMYTEEGEVLEPNSIVEFRYEMSAPSGFKWIPLRARHDKTAQYLLGDAQYGNDYDTANNVWKSIHLPISEEIIQTGTIPENYKNPDDLDDYYQMGGDDDARSVLQVFHNYVKTRLLETVLTRKCTVIDLSCGRGGDLYKWVKAGTAFVFGIDYAKTNIDNRFSGAYVRYLQYRLKNTSEEITKCIFVTGDSSKNIKSGEAFSDDKNSEVAAAVYGKKSTYAATIGDLYGIGKSVFNVASCQFSLHYFFKDIATIKEFMTNVSQNLGMNGKFVATCFDGAKVFELLQNSGAVGEVSIMSSTDPTKLYWRCSKRYTSDIFLDDSTSVGYGIEVYQKSIGKSFVEYLVNKVYLSRVMEQYGFKATSIVSFEDIYRKLPRSPHFDTHRQLGSLPERIVSFLNVQYIFTKVADIDPLTVVLEDLGSGSMA